MSAPRFNFQTLGCEKSWVSPCLKGNLRNLGSVQLRKPIISSVCNVAQELDSFRFAIPVMEFWEGSLAVTLAYSNL